MLATRWPALFQDDGWQFELKWDGVRALLTWDGTEVKLRSRAGNDVTERYPEVADFEWRAPAVLDGEIVALDESGRPSFGLLQKRMNLASPRLIRDAVSSAPVNYVVFDVLYAGTEVIHEPLERRREMLLDIELPAAMVRSEATQGDSEGIWEFVQAEGLEGIVGKRGGSVYRPGTRSSDWRKISAFHTVRATVGGFTRGEGARAHSFGALVLGLWDGDHLRWIGSVGSGFDGRALRAVRAALDEMSSERSAFHDPDAIPGEVTWVEPVLVASVQYKEWTSGGRLRAPSFKGFTDDAPSDVTWAVEGPDASG